MASDLHDLARMMHALPQELAKAQHRGVQKTALAVTRQIRQETRAATGGDSRLSGVGRRGARVGVRYDVRGTRNPTAIVKATGPYQLIEHDTKPHDITPRRRRSRKDTRRALQFADGTFRASASHPGTRAKKPFERGYLASRGQAGRVFDREVQAGIRKALR